MVEISSSRGLFSRKSRYRTWTTQRSSGIWACSRSCALMRQLAHAAMRRGPKRSRDWYQSTKKAGRPRGCSNFQRAWTKSTGWVPTGERPQESGSAAAWFQAGCTSTRQPAERDYVDRPQANHNRSGSLFPCHARPKTPLAVVWVFGGMLAATSTM